MWSWVLMLDRPSYRPRSERKSFEKIYSGCDSYDPAEESNAHLHDQQQPRYGSGDTCSLGPALEERRDMCRRYRIT